MEPTVRLVRAPEATDMPQGFPYFVGICARTAGATGLSLSHVVVPPGAVSEPHFHDGFETAIYQLSGRVETRYGPALEHSVVSEAGDFLFIPAGLPHQARNLSYTEPASAIVARNDPSEHESIVFFDPGVGPRARKDRPLDP